MASERKTARGVYADNPVEAYINGVIDKDELIDALLRERGLQSIPAAYERLEVHKDRSIGNLRQWTVSPPHDGPTGEGPVYHLVEHIYALPDK